jgi:hypothetical protein
MMVGGTGARCLFHQPSSLPGAAEPREYPARETKNIYLFIREEQDRGCVSNAIDLNKEGAEVSPAPL